ncbi:NAD(P)H-dependent oxidoreductase [bacterium]|nr:NAD(P)H-dependent oxidoreductase [bacterium]
MTKKLVAYFSPTGVTEGVAKKIAQMTGADLYEIQPKEPYTRADLNWTDEKSRSTIEMKDLDFRPEMLALPENIKEYDTIFLGFPIWWYIAPTIINTFLESHDFTGITIAPFFTSAGSDAGNTDDHLHLSAPNAFWRPAKRLYPNNDERIKLWLDNAVL